MAVLLVLAACGSGVEDSEEPIGVDVDREFGDLGLEEMWEAADVVVVGEVTNEASGASGADGEPSWSSTLFIVEVDEVLRGPETASVDVSIGTHMGGREIEMGGRITPRIGDSGVWFLNQIDPAHGIDAYRLTNDQGPAVAGADGRIRTNELERLGTDIEVRGSQLADLVSDLRALDY